MKKFLSLVLALVMTMSLVTIGAGAKDFDDSDSIDYGVAVAVMSEVKVVEGYPDGSFGPEKTLTRAEAAKIICNMILGPTTASALKADTAPFSDVPTSHWASGYIAYCANQGTIKGYGDGKFGPSDTLTGYAFMKMLLTALGYDASIEGYVGANWSINVAKRALGIGLDDGLKADFDGTKPVTREEACLYAFNTLQADLVKYDNQSSITVGDIVISTNSKAEPDDVRNTDMENNIKIEAAGYEVPQFAERYFTKLVAAPSRDKLGRPITSWKYDKGDAIDEIDTADAVYSDKPENKDVYSDLGLSTATSFYYYINGVPQVGSYSVVKNDSDVGIAGLGDGVNVEVFQNKATPARNTISVYYTYAGKVTKIGTNSDDNREATVSISNWANGSSLKVENEVVEKNDIVQVNVGWTGSAYAIAEIEKVEKLTGTVTKVVGSDTYYIDGEKYKVNTVGDIAGVSAGDEVEYYLDSNGYILKLDPADSNAVSDLAFVAASGTDRGVNWAKLILTDGSKKVVDLDDSESITTTFTPNAIVKFKTNKSGLVEHQALNAYVYGAATGSNAYYLTKGVTEVKYGAGSLSGTGIKVNGKTTIMVIENNDVFVYTGVANIPALKASTITASWKNSDTTSDPAQLIVLNAVPGTIENSNAKLKLFAIKKGEDLVKVDGISDYYEILDVKTGETVALKSTVLPCTAMEVYVAKTYSTNSDKQISSLTRADAGSFYYAVDDTVKIAGDTITVNSAYTVSGVATVESRYINDDVAIYVLGKSLDEITDTWTLADLDDFNETISSSNDYKYATFTVDDDGYVDTIVLVSSK